MGLYNYSSKASDEKKVARAQIHDVNASYKDMSQVMTAIRGKPYAEALQIVEGVISKKKAIKYKKFAKHLGHRSELGGARGRYPAKEAKIVLALLKNAKANADSKGLEDEALRVASCAAYKQDMFMRYRKYFAGGAIIGYGRQSFASKYVTCRGELTLDEGAKKRKQATKKEEEKKEKVVKRVEEKKLPAPKVDKKQEKKEEKKAEVMAEGVTV